MTKYLAAVLFSFTLFSCNSNNAPDVSNIKINISTERFEQDLFKMDTVHYLQQCEALQKKYPVFFPLFAYEILGADPLWSKADMFKYVSQFATDSTYQSVFNAAEKKTPDFSFYSNEVKKALQYTKYYFPKYKVPSKIITYVGPLDGIANDVIPGEILAIGLQAHLGKDFSLYKADAIRQIYPEYKSMQFETDYIVINTATNILQTEIYPANSEDKPLIEQMVEKGKRLFALSKILPDIPEYKLIGYTKEQIDACYKQEAVIWDMFIQNSYLQVTEQNIVKNYIGESPKTQELGEGAPGNIGSFSGWQIVKKYISKNDKVSLEQLLRTDAETIYREAKYKP